MNQKLEKMKKVTILLVLACLLGTGFARAQNTEGKLNDKGRLALAVWIPDQIENFPIAARNTLENKLNQILTDQGIAGDAYNSRFILTANVVMLTKSITPTSPPMQAYTLNITFYIGDGFEGKSFASYSITSKGVGENETKAYMSALKTVRTNDPGFQALIEKGKAKIIEYFNTKCDFIIKEAKVAEGQNQFDEAIWKLTSVPDVCADCWNKCQDAVQPIFQQKIDYECKTKLAEANNIWAAGQNYGAADAAASILSSIDPESSCYKDIKPLTDKISKRVFEVDKREWNFKVDQEIGLERDRIKAIRDIGVAYGNGQPKTVIYKSLW